MSKNLNTLIDEEIDLKIDMTSVAEKLRNLTISIKETPIQRPKIPKIPRPAIYLPELQPETISAIRQLENTLEELGKVLNDAIKAQIPKSEIAEVFTKLSMAVQSPIKLTSLVSNVTNSALASIDSLPETQTFEAKIAITRASEITLDQIRDVVREENELSERRMEAYIDAKISTAEKKSSIEAHVLFILSILISAYISLYPDVVRVFLASIGEAIQQAVIPAEQNSVESE